jgi:hypothetical protein
VAAQGVQAVRQQRIVDVQIKTRTNAAEIVANGLWGTDVSASNLHRSDNRKMKTLITVGIVVVIAAITNPGKQAHVDAVKEFLLESANEKMMTELDGANKWETVGAALGYTLGVNVIDKMAGSFVRSRNFVIFSTTVVTYKGESKTIGIGGFGNVWLFKKIDQSVLQQE